MSSLGEPIIYSKDDFRNALRFLIIDSARVIILKDLITSNDSDLHLFCRIYDKVFFRRISPTQEEIDAVLKKINLLKSQVNETNLCESHPKKTLLLLLKC